MLLRCAAAVVLLGLTALALVAQVGSTFEQITVSTSPASIAAATLQPAGQQPPLKCAVRVEFASVRYRLDGSTATAAIGIPLLADVDTVILTPAQANAFSVHGAGASPSRSAQVNVWCW